jgi:hypothetical protein
MSLGDALKQCKPPGYASLPACGLQKPARWKRCVPRRFTEERA